MHLTKAAILGLVSAIGFTIAGSFAPEHTRGTAVERFVGYALIIAFVVVVAWLSGAYRDKSKLRRSEGLDGQPPLRGIADRSSADSH